jgi:hypothetical protein
LNFNSTPRDVNPNLEVADHPEINFGTGNLTIDAWVFVPQPSSIFIHPIVDKLATNPAGTQGTGYALDLGSSFANGARLQFIMGGGGTLVGYGPNAPSVPFNTWTHIAVALNRSAPGTVSFYVNGVLVPSPSPSMPAASINNNLPLLIGESRSPGTWQGTTTVDELEMFRRALTQGEIQSIVNAGAGGKCKCLTASNETITCNPDGTFKYTFTLTNLSGSTAGGAVVSPIGNVTVTPVSTLFPPLTPGSSTPVTVTIGGAGAISGANVCFTVGLVSQGVISCRTQQCIKLPSCQLSTFATPRAYMLGWWPLKLNELKANVPRDAGGGQRYRR